jgi:Protein of unknown function (DUF2892)
MWTVAQHKEMTMKFAHWMATPVGRLLRVAVGLALIGWGYLIGSTVLMVVGAVPLLAGASNVCLIAPLLRAPFLGKNAL